METRPTPAAEKPVDVDVLVTPGWLEAHLSDPDLRVIEIDVSPVAFEAGHIDGAVLWNVYRDLKDPAYRPVTRAAVGALLARSGVSPDSTVVFYGYAPAMGVWLLSLYGHADARILDCRRQDWRDQGRPWSTGGQLPAATSYPLAGETDPIRARWEDVEQAISGPATTILDVRSGPEFRGEQFWPSGGSEPGGRAGHVPSAVNVTVDGGVYDEHGAFRTAGELGELFGAIDPDGDGDLIVYCTIGGRACTAWFVLTHLLGRRNVRVYDGSWAEWGLMPTTPVATTGQGS